MALAFLALARAGIAKFAARSAGGPLTAASAAEQRFARFNSTFRRETALRSGRAGERALGVQMAKKIGQWPEARRILGPDAPLRVARAMRMALRDEARMWKKELTTGIRKQAPGGQAFKPLADSTLDWRKLHNLRGKRALIRTGDMVRAIKMRSMRDVVFVGILNGERTRDGKSMTKIASRHETGDVIFITPTPKMRRFFFALLRASGKLDPDARGGGAGGFSKGVVIITIPERPFFKPVHEKLNDPVAARNRFYARMTIILKGDFGRVLAKLK